MRSFLRVPVALAAATLTLVGLAACAPASTDTSSGNADLLASVDTMFGTIDIPQPEGELRVVALGWSDAEMALSLGVQPVAVFDWQGFGAENNGVGPWAADLFDTAPEIIERGNESLNYEQIELLAPDVILNVRSGNDQQEWQRLSEIAPTVYAPAGTAAFATTWDVQVDVISQALGKGQAGANLAEELRGQIDAAAAANPDFADKTISSVAKFGDAYGAYLAGDGRFDLLSQLGFTQAPGVAQLEPAGFFANASVEQVPLLDADVVLVLPIGFTQAEVEADPLIASLPASQAGRTIVLDPSSELSGAYSAASVLSLPLVLDQLVPLLAKAAAA